MVGMSSPLERFSPAARQWFAGAFGQPTPAQEGAWEAISQGQHTLVVAPTGSGKTLAAFLWALDRLLTPGEDSSTSSAGEQVANRSSRRAPHRTKVLYLSPLKALGVDIERNLRSPLVGITQTARFLGQEPGEVSIGIRSGDTPARERRQLLTNPPDILITTPESLYLMLTSKARASLSEVHTVIVDEVHAVAGSKRGAHLAVSLERLDQLLPRPAQRIGLSATVEPAETVARFLGGTTPVSVVRPEAQKHWDLQVSMPVPDMTQLSTPVPRRGSASELPAEEETPHEVISSIWPHLEERIVDLVEQNRSTIVFANSRGLAERLTSRLNEVYAFRQQHRNQASAAASGPDASEASSASEVPSTSEIPYAPPAPNHLNSGTAPAELARAHHGSVSKDQRALIEDALKSGALRCVVATSSLELGIDMGAVDLVIQVESPPSVASGLQRVGRAGHQVGQTSRAVIFPQHRGDLRHAAVTAERMRAGAIEPLHIPANPLDILAQQTVAAAALGPIDVETWFEALRRTAPFTALPRSAFDAVLDLLSGKHPSDEFAELRPRLIWDREAGVLEPRPGAQRVAVTSGGTIPDRGLYPVFITGSEAEGRGAKRVGELDEEMVYESRAGDIIALGAASWRIEEITHDRVNVTPAPGMVGKLPFWHGDGPGRPVELGEALGRFTRELTAAASSSADRTSAGDDAAAARLRAAGLDAWAADNLLAHLREQREATGQVPSEKTLMIERFRDELDDWRVILHSPFGMPVHGPWALAVGRRIDELYGLDASAMAADDGIVLRIPAMDQPPPGAELFLLDPEQIEQVVTEQLGSSALFAARFRECAARALLLPRRDPGRRTPLWQQRQRSAQLLAVARKHSDFPIILETVRECLQDVYDLPALRKIHQRIERREIIVREIETPRPSPFARTLLFSYVGQFLYNTDAPLAERKAAALSLDPSLLAELLGQEELRELLDAEVIRQTEAQLQRLASDRRLHGVEGFADLLRLLGPLTVAEAAARLEDGENASAYAEQLVRAKRAFTVRQLGEAADVGEPGGLGVTAVRMAGTRLAAVEDAARLRDGLGAPLPLGVPAAFIEPVADPLGDLVSRYARTHGPFTTGQAAQALRLGRAVVHSVLERLAADHRVTPGRFLPPELLAEHRTPQADEAPEGALPRSADEPEWCDTAVLRTLRRRSLARLRSQIEPVDPGAYARFLPAWQHIRAHGAAEDPRVEDADGLLTVIDQIAGVPLPASAVETLILPTRVRSYTPALLDEALISGDVLWTGAGTIPGQDGWISLHLAESADLTVPETPAVPLAELSENAQRVYGAIGEAADFAPRIAARAGLSLGAAGEALWELVWAGLATNDGFGPLRAFLDGGKTAHARPKAAGRSRAHGRRGAGRITTARLGRAGAAGAAGAASRATASGLGLEAGPGGVAPGSGLSPQRERELSGRWSRVSSALSEEPLDPTVRAVATAQLLLDRYGVLTRGAAAQEEVPGGFARMYQVLSAQEDHGEARRGYFIEGLGGAQFAAPATVDLLRSTTVDEQMEDSRSEPREPQVLALAATDPAQAYGSTLSWPEAVRPAELLGRPESDGDDTIRMARPGRKAGALVVLVDGAPVLYMERGGKTMLAFTSSPRQLELAAPAVASVVRLGASKLLVVEKVNGVWILEHGAAGLDGATAPITVLREALVTAGFSRTPKGLRLRR